MQRVAFCHLRRRVPVLGSHRPISFKQLVFGKSSEVPKVETKEAVETLASKNNNTPRRTWYPKQSVVLVMGGTGTLGNGVLNACRWGGWKTVCVDYKKSETADHSVILDKSMNWQENVPKIIEDMESYLGDLSKDKPLPQRFDAVVSAGGAWDGGTALKSPFESSDQFYQRIFNTSLASTQLARHLLCPGGVLMLTGAAPTLQLVHADIGWRALLEGWSHLVVNLASDKGFQDQSLRVGGIVPFAVDTPENRRAVQSPSALDALWVDPHIYSRNVYDYIEGREFLRSGSLLEYRFPDGVPQLFVVRQPPQ